MVGFRSGLGLGLGCNWQGERLDQFTWPHQARYMVHFSSSRFRFRFRFRFSFRVRVRVRVRVRLGFRFRLGRGAGGSVPVATTDSIHSTCIKL